MTYFPLTTQQQEWKDRAADIALRELAPRAAAVDKQAQYPQESLDALRQAGLCGLRVSREHDGLGADLLRTCLIVEELAKQCPSTAMYYKMRIEASEVISRIPTDDQIEHFLRRMTRGEVFATVSGSSPF